MRLWKKVLFFALDSWISLVSMCWNIPQVPHNSQSNKANVYEWKFTGLSAVAKTAQSRATKRRQDHQQIVVLRFFSSPNDTNRTSTELSHKEANLLTLNHLFRLFAFRTWFMERNNFTYGSHRNNLDVVGHYTQMIWASTHKVGCGLAKCARGGPRDKPFFNYVCNYCPMWVRWIVFPLIRQISSDLMEIYCGTRCTGHGRFHQRFVANICKTF